jgi:hypothetical protein
LPNTTKPSSLGNLFSTSNQGRVPHISLVFREMWDSTALSLRLSIHPMPLTVNIGGIPHLAKNERDMGDQSLVRERGVALSLDSQRAPKAIHS